MPLHEALLATGIYEQKKNTQKCSDLFLPFCLNVVETTVSSDVFLTHTCAPTAVQGETCRTLTTEGALGVHTAAVGTNSREDLALVDVFRGTVGQKYERQPQ